MGRVLCARWHTRQFVLALMRPDGHHSVTESEETVHDSSGTKCEGTHEHKQSATNRTNDATQTQTTQAEQQARRRAHVLSLARFANQNM